MNQHIPLKDFLTDLDNELKQKSPRGSGRLADSIKSSIVNKPGKDFEYTIEVEMESYGEFVDKGVNGAGYKGEGKGKIRKAVVKGSPFSFRSKMPPPIAFSKYTTDKNHQFAIARSIFSRGIKPADFIDPVLDKYTQKLGDYVIEDIQKYIDDIKL